MKSESKNIDPNTVFVKNINYKTTAEDLAKAFEKYGKIESSRIMKDRIYGQFFSRGTGFVEFVESKSVEQALADNDLTVDGRKLEIKDMNDIKHQTSTLLVIHASIQVFKTSLRI